MQRRRLVLAAVVMISVAFGAFAFAISSTRSASPGLSVEGIHVQGHWKLVVKNPGGRIVLVRRFHNDPTQANQAIATMLTRAYTPGYWFIRLGSSTVNGPACVANGSPDSCLIIDPNDNGAYSSSASAFKTLVTSSSNFQDHITLTGSINAQRDGDVNTVDTNLGVCSRSVAPATACGLSSFWPFTGRTLGSPVSLVTGQQLLVTVTLTFT